MTFLNSLPFDRLLWLVPVFFMLHNIEEAPFMADWSKRLPLKIHPIVSTRQFVIAVTFLTLGGLLVTYLALERMRNSTGILLVLGIQAVMAFNAFVPHLASTLRFRMYSPGLVTAVLLTVPFSYYLFQRGLNEHHLTWPQLWILMGISPFVMVLCAYLSLLIGKALAK
ncbi:MAG: HXXEE domain-containing protein [Anaerolineales bacterium]|nr:HXXEE domain-containing protein [Anaerolineales bacterium]